MATFGAIASPNPNVLFDPAGAIAAGQQIQSNRLLMENRAQDQAWQAEDRQRAEFERDREEAGRFAYAVKAQPPEKRKEFYETGMAQFQAQGRMRRSPLSYPGDDHMDRAITFLLTPAQLEARRTLETEQAGLAGMFPGAPAAAPASVPSVPGAAPAASPAVADVPADLMPHFEEASRATGIPVPLLIAQAKQESGFRADATGRSGEIGIMQVMPSTAQQPGFGLQPVDPATLRDPRANIMFGAQYLAARNKGVDWNDPAQRDAGLGRYNGGGDPNYAANVTRNLAAPAPQPTPPGGVAARTGGTDVAGPGAPAGPAAPGGIVIDPPGTPDWARGTTAEDQVRLRALSKARGMTKEKLIDEASKMAQANRLQQRWEQSHPVSTGPAAPFSGNGIEPQVYNTMLALGPKIADGTASDAERQQYALAHGHLSRGTVQMVDDGKGGQVLARIPGVVPPSFPAPDFQPGAPAAAAGGGGAPGQGAAQPIPGTAKPAQTATADDRSKLRDIETNAQGIVDALDDFVETRANASTGERAASVLGAPTTLSTAYGNAGLLAKGKALYDLGVLNGPDLDIIRRVLADPSTVRGGALTSQETVKAQADKIKELLRKRLETARQQFGGAPSVAGPTPGSTAEPPPAPGKRPPLSSFGG